MDVSKRVFLITGANRGLGRSIAEAALMAGAKVYAAARDPASVDLPGCVPVELDVNVPDHIALTARSCLDVNVLVNNAGISKRSSLLGEHSLDDGMAELRTNCLGPWHLSREFVPVLRANREGVIVNVLSVLSWVIIPRSSTYCMSKSAAWGMTNGLRLEVRESGTRVIGVHVGYMDTDLAAGVDVPKISPHDVAQQILSAVQDGHSEEVIADALSREVKKGLSNRQGIYLQSV